MIFRAVFGVLFCLFILCGSQSCQQVSSMDAGNRESPQEESTKKGRIDLIQRFRENPHMTLVYAAQSPYAKEIKEHLQALAERARWLFPYH